MLKQLSYIPLPLRIIGVLVIGLLLYKALGAIIGSFLLVIMILIWLLVLITLMYEFGWLNFLANVPMISTLLAFLTNRKALAQSDGSGASTQSAGVLNDEERQELYQKANARLNQLEGAQNVRAQIFQRILDPAESNPENPFATQSPALVIVFHGPPGTGKTTAAIATAQMLTGMDTLKTANVVTLRESDYRMNRSGSAIEFGQQKAREALGGTLLLDGADWMLKPPSYANEDGPGVEIGLGILEIARQNPLSVLVLATMSDTAAKRLNSDPSHAKWLSKLTHRSISFDPLDDDALLSILDDQINASGWSLENTESKRAASRLLTEVADRAGDAFDHAEACRRIAEKLIETAREEGLDSEIENRVVSRDIVRLTDDQLE